MRGRAKLPSWLWSRTLPTQGALYRRCRSSSSSSSNVACIWHLAAKCWLSASSSCAGWGKRHVQPAAAGRLHKLPPHTL